MSTMVQAAVTGALSELGFESIPPEGDKVGGPQQLKVTKATLERLTEGTVVTVVSDGTVSVE